jgi:aminopeptidase N
MSNNATLVHLADYAPFSHRVHHIALFFDIQPEETTVRAVLELERAPGIPAERALRLDGEDLELLGLVLDGVRLPAERYRRGEGCLLVEGLPERCELEILTRIRPQLNTQLSGLYKSGGMYCTQCEAEGFRRITYFPDRPDVLARFTTTIEADHGEFPVLLAGGNLMESGLAEGGRHWVRWEDPFPKPCYLFAMVAGRLEHIEDRFTTMSGREVTLRIYTESHNIRKCDWAMASLIRSMRWDEEVYGREYDLDIFMIVAVDDFNMGAMENKGLNIFNSSVVLARPEATTDEVFSRIEGVVAHEYFHNWTGNRVTCRDWFQLTLKEGLTVFRDQEFSADMGSRAVKRIADVLVLRQRQFPEDASPMAHAIQPVSYRKIDNFYTVTVYEKGAEVIRMLHTLLGAEGFRRGTDLYFKRHDGSAVTTEDFVRALEDGAGVDLGQFRRWYRQVGTPRLHASRHWDAAAGRLSLEFRQEVPGWAGDGDRGPLHLPMDLALLDGAGRELPLRLAGEEASGEAPTRRVLELREEVQRFDFVGLATEPVPSLLRGFSAPVRLELERSEEELAFLFARDTDPFCRWEAGQALFTAALLRAVAALQRRETPRIGEHLAAACRAALADADGDPAFTARALAMPGYAMLEQEFDPVPVDEVWGAILACRRGLAAALHDELLELIGRSAAHGAGGWSQDGRSVGWRALGNLSLGYLTALNEPDLDALALRRYHAADNMTDTLGALSALTHGHSPQREEAFADFYRRWREDSVVINQWFSLQAVADRGDTLHKVRELLGHEAFDLRNPNKVRALLVGFSQANPARFHARDGAAYEFVADQVLAVDALNPQMGASLARGFTRWKRFDEPHRQAMRAQLERLAAAATLSSNAREIVGRSLEA